MQRNIEVTRARLPNILQALHNSSIPRMIPVLQQQPHFRETAEGLRLVANRADAVSEFAFPPTQFWGDASVVPEVLLIENEGTLYTFTVVHLGRDRPPYMLGMVDFECGMRVFGPLLAPSGSRPSIGARVRTVAHPLPDGTPDYAFSVEGGNHD
jgi:hypothetical protein